MAEQLDDKELLFQFKVEATRELAFTRIIKKYQEKLYWHIRRMVVEHEDANDVLQNMFIKVWKSLENFREDSQLYTWLYRIATNEALQQLAKMKKMQKADEDAEHHMQRLVADNAEHDAEEIQILLQKAIQTLPEKQKLVFNIRYYDELPFEEISKILDMSVSTCKTNYHYAKEKIENYIRENHEI